MTPSLIPRCWASLPPLGCGQSRDKQPCFLWGRKEGRLGPRAVLSSRCRRAATRADGPEPWQARGQGRWLKGQDPRRACRRNRCAAPLGWTPDAGAHSPRAGPALEVVRASKPRSWPLGHPVFCLAPQIEPSSHHLSPEEVESRVFWGYRGALGSRPSSPNSPCQAGSQPSAFPVRSDTWSPPGMCPGCQGGWWRSRPCGGGWTGIQR